MMNRIIEKTSTNIANFREARYFYLRARDAFYDLLSQSSNSTTILLPAYIGYSPNEGSGIFDPVISSERHYRFYALDANLHVDISSLKQVIRQTEGPIICLIVHYYGFIDPNIEQVIALLRERKTYIIEDCAHALYTSFVDGVCGNLGDASVYSLHKMLPMEHGGMLMLRGESDFKPTTIVDQHDFLDGYFYNFWGIAKKRKENARRLENNIADLTQIRILRPSNCYPNQTPQTLPIIVPESRKNEMYHSMNAAGFGAVSLYHTLIQPLQTQPWHDMQNVSHSIINLPVHQDITEKQIDSMGDFIHEFFK